MRIGAMGYSPYIYNTNYISANSMNKVAPIEDDLTAFGTDYSSLGDDSLNENPLQKGETLHFMDVISMQFHMSRLNASRLMKPAEEASQSSAQEFSRKQGMGTEEIKFQAGSEEAKETLNIEAMDLQQDMMADGADDVVRQISPAAQTMELQQDRNLFMMQRAAEAYRVNMIA